MLYNKISDKLIEKLKKYPFLYGILFWTFAFASAYP